MVFRRKIGYDLNARKERVKKDKPFIDHIIKDENLQKSYEELAKELNIPENEVRRIFWVYKDALENKVFYKVDVLQFLDD